MVRQRMGLQQQGLRNGPCYHQVIHNYLNQINPCRFPAGIFFCLVLSACWLLLFPGECNPFFGLPEKVWGRSKNYCTPELSRFWMLDAGVAIIVDNCRFPHCIHLLRSKSGIRIVKMTKQALSVIPISVSAQISRPEISSPRQEAILKTVI